MFKAVHLLQRRQHSKLTVHDEVNHVIADKYKVSSLRTKHFENQFQDGVGQGVNMFEGPLKSLNSPITAAEVVTAFARLNNNWACGYDSIPGKLLKYAPAELSRLIADAFNDVFEKHQPLNVGVLKALQKPGKPLARPKSLRPIVLLTTLRKTLSLITLQRISDKVNDFFSPSQSGFRRGRSTADVIWGHRWLVAKCQRYKYVIEILAIDLSRAFDTIRRGKFLNVLHSFLDTNNVRIIRLLLSETNITVRVDDTLSAPFNTTVGPPQGDSLSPVLFIVYLEAALRTLCGCLPRRPPADINLPCEAIYADDTDFISTDHEYLSKVNKIAPAAQANGSCMSMSTKQSAQTSNVLQKNGG